MRSMKALLLAGMCSLALAVPAAAADYKVGAGVSLSGYLAFVDKAWTDALNLAADDINKKGGINGDKVVVIAAWKDFCLSYYLIRPFKFGRIYHAV